MRKGKPEKVSGLGARGLSFAVIASRWNGDIVERLLDGALRVLRGAGAGARSVSVVRVPGSFELVPACRRAMNSPRRFSAVVALGCLIRGETPHFEILAHAVGGALAQLNATSRVPVTFGVLTCDNRKQALARSGGRGGNAGAEAARAAIEIARLGESF